MRSGMQAMKNIIKLVKVQWRKNLFFLLKFMVENWVLKYFFNRGFLCALCFAIHCYKNRRIESTLKIKKEKYWKPLNSFASENYIFIGSGVWKKPKKKIMERDSSSSIRHRASRTTRAQTPEPTRSERISKSSDRDVKFHTRDVVVDATDDTKYIVRGILNVGPPSPSGSASSSSSGSVHAGTSGSHAYRAKLLRYKKLLH